MATYDELDFFILEKIYFAKPEITTWGMAKQYFPTNTKTKKGIRKLEGKHILIKQRLKKMEGVGLVKIKKDKKGKNEYFLLVDNVIFSKHKFPNGYKKAVLIKDNSKWICFQL